MIVDEAHARIMHTDLILTLVRKKCLNPDSNLKLIVASATLNQALFRKYLKDCPVVEISDRQFPLQIKHLNDPNLNEFDSILEIILECIRNSRKNIKYKGDILIFGPDEFRKNLKQFVDQKFLEKKEYSLYTIGLHDIWLLNKLK